MLGSIFVWTVEGFIMSMLFLTYTVVSKEIQQLSPSVVNLVDETFSYILLVSFSFAVIGHVVAANAFHGRSTYFRYIGLGLHSAISNLVCSICFMLTFTYISLYADACLLGLSEGKLCSALFRTAIWPLVTLPILSVFMVVVFLLSIALSLASCPSDMPSFIFISKGVILMTCTLVAWILPVAASLTQDNYRVCTTPPTNSTLFNGTSPTNTSSTNTPSTPVEVVEWFPGTKLVYNIYHPLSVSAEKRIPLIFTIFCCMAAATGVLFAVLQVFASGNQDHREADTDEEDDDDQDEKHKKSPQWVKWVWKALLGTVTIAANVWYILLCFTVPIMASLMEQATKGVTGMIMAYSLEAVGIAWAASDIFGYIVGWLWSLFYLILQRSRQRSKEKGKQTEPDNKASDADTDKKTLDADNKPNAVPAQSIPVDPKQKEETKSAGETKSTGETKPTGETKQGQANTSDKSAANTLDKQPQASPASLYSYYGSPRQHLFANVRIPTAAVHQSTTYNNNTSASVDLVPPTSVLYMNDTTNHYNHYSKKEEDSAAAAQPGEEGEHMFQSRGVRSSLVRQRGAGTDQLRTYLG